MDNFSVLSHGNNSCFLAVSNKKVKNCWQEDQLVKSRSTSTKVRPVFICINNNIYVMCACVGCLMFVQYSHFRINQKQRKWIIHSTWASFITVIWSCIVYAHTRVWYVCLCFHAVKQCAGKHQSACKEADLALCAVFLSAGSGSAVRTGELQGQQGRWGLCV